jgi:hypothetical protein
MAHPENITEIIRRRAYELWEEAGRSGFPQDHWLRAEREVSSDRDRSEATLEEANPTEAVAAKESVAPRSSPKASSGAKGERSTEP